MIAYGILLYGLTITDYQLQSKAPKKLFRLWPQMSRADHRHPQCSQCAPSVQRSQLSKSPFIHSFMGVCLADLAIANQKVSFNCIKDCCTITGSITEISEQRVLVHPIYLRSQNSELGVTSHSSWSWCTIFYSKLIKGVAILNSELWVVKVTLTFILELLTSGDVVGHEHRKSYLQGIMEHTIISAD